MTRRGGGLAVKVQAGEKERPECKVVWCGFVNCSGVVIVRHAPYFIFIGSSNLNT